MHSPSSCVRSSSPEERDSRRSSIPRQDSTLDGSGDASLSTNGDEASAVLQPNFVLLGRGRGYQRHAGNVAFAALVNSSAAMYSSASITRKQAIVKEIMSKVYDNGGGFRRFHKRTRLYVPVDYETARQKVMHAIQHVLRRSDATQSDIEQKTLGQAKHKESDDESLGLSHLDNDAFEHLFQEEYGEESLRTWLPPAEGESPRTESPPAEGESPRTESPPTNTYL